MSILSRPAPKVNPVRSTVVLFDGGGPRKPARSFGRGLSRYAGQYGGRQPYTSADAREAARMFADAADEMSDREWDRLADEAAFLDRYVRGCC